MGDGAHDDFGFVQRSAAVLQMAEKGGKKEGGEEDEEVEGAGEEDEGLGRDEGDDRQNGGSTSPERKSGELSPNRPETVQHAGSSASAAATGDTGARESGGSDSSSIGSFRGKAVGRLLRTMSGHKAKDGGPKLPSSQAVDPTLNQLPQSFLVKYLGKRDAMGLWGIKHTRRPVDSMVKAAKGDDGQAPLVLPLVKLTVSGEGVTLSATGSAAGDKKKKKQHEVTVFHPIETISYGVQDLVYTRVFSMIIVRESTQVIGAGQNSPHPFQCHGFVCDSRNSARRLTYVLAAAFQEFSRHLKAEDAKDAGKKRKSFKKFAIDLRTPEQIEEDLKQPESEA